MFGLNLKFHKCVVSIQLPITHKKLLVNVFVATEFGPVIEQSSGWPPHQNGKSVNSVNR